MRTIHAYLNLCKAPSLGILTENRNFGAVTFLGRYGLMDFALSNFTNSGIDKIDILTDRCGTSLRSHIQSGKTFINNTNSGSITVVHSESNGLKPKYNNEVTDILDNFAQISDIKCKYVIVAPAHYLCKIDYNILMKKHIESGADITVLTKNVEGLKSTYRRSDIVTLKDDNITSIKPNKGKAKAGTVSLEVYFMDKTTFYDLAKSQKKINRAFGLRDLINYAAKKELYVVKSLDYEYEVFPILNLEEYVSTSFDLFSYTKRCALFKPEWPIYTTTHNTPPALYGPHADVKNSFIANGSIIKGKVENSIISREVVVEEGASVSNSILFTATKVERGSELVYALTDKGVVIEQNSKIVGRNKKIKSIKAE